MERVKSRYQKARIEAEYIFNSATLSRDFTPDVGHEITEPSFLLLGKTEEVKNILTYIVMLMDERGRKLKVVDEAKGQCKCS